MLAWLGLGLAEDAVEHEHHRGRGHIAVVAEDLVGEAQLLGRQSDLPLHGVEHLRAAGVDDPPVDGVLGQAVPVQEAADDLGDRPGPDDRDISRQNVAQPAALGRVAKLLAILGQRDGFEVEEAQQAGGRRLEDRRRLRPAAYRLRA